MLVTLTTDFSDSGGFTAQLKAKLIELFGEDIRIVDITHSISAFNAVEAAYIVRTTIPKFKKGTIHIVVIDPNVGSDRAIVAAEFNDKYIISPDNEALSMIEPNYVVEIDKNLINPSIQTTFEAYEIMVPAAYLLHKEGINSLGKQSRLKTPKLFPIKGNKTIKGKIVYIDRFGNCITNIEGYLLKNGFAEINIKTVSISSLSTTYSQTGTLCKAIINSSGFLEFALYKNSFSKRFNINYLDDVDVILL